MFLFKSPCLSPGEEPGELSICGKGFVFSKNLLFAKHWSGLYSHKRQTERKEGRRRSVNVSGVKAEVGREGRE